MSFYHTNEGVSEYIKMAEGYDGRELVDVLSEHVDANARVLELGMGPGVDLDLLKTHFAVTGSDYSRQFLDRYRTTHPDADLVQLDAISLKTDRRFDAIYSNKVLHHLEDDDLQKSIQRQHDVLNPHGILMHSFWYGDQLEEHAGMKFYYRNEAFLTGIFSTHFRILQLERYTEMEENDSVLLLARRAEIP